MPVTTIAGHEIPRRRREGSQDRERRVDEQPAEALAAATDVGMTGRALEGDPLPLRDDPQGPEGKHLATLQPWRADRLAGAGVAKHALRPGFLGQPPPSRRLHRSACPSSAGCCVCTTACRRPRPQPDRSDGGDLP